ncbi:MAG: family 78 glycoside hydrolase catalytic domain [Anaerolineae bacterium]|nr:family 78 glycoside hydrolase catalytic domain [Anaerolineae bacterium]
MKVESLTFEHLHNPIGVDVLAPRFSWKCVSESDEKDLFQLVYRVQVSSCADSFEQPHLLWDSGEVQSDASVLVPYEGPALASRQRLFWRVKVWDNNGVESNWSEPAWFEMGLLAESDWQARWIEPEQDFDPQHPQPGSYSRVEFGLGGAVKRARLYMTSLGFYQAFLNGCRVGAYAFAPTRTNYRKLIHYQTYDVTDLLKEGANALGVVQGDGWLRGKGGIHNDRNVHGERLAILAQLEVELTDGSKVVVCSDEAWKASQNGPMRVNDPKEGEDYDARLEMPGWDLPNFDDSAWHNVRVTDGCGAKVCASNSVPIAEKEQFAPTVLTTPDGSTVLDFGQNIAGIVTFRVQGERGHTVKLVHGETLNQFGNFSIKHLSLPFLGGGGRFQQLEYTLKGGGVESYKTMFMVSGFRYVKLFDWPCAVKAEDFSAIAVYSDMPETASFECSNPLVTQLFQNTLWSQKGNFLDVPTDCPTRERGGWSGDAQIFVRTGTYLMDTAAFFHKWLKEMAVQQGPDGIVPNLIPAVAGADNQFEAGVMGSAGWGDAAVIIPWTMWKMTGDTRFLENNWEMMKKWVDYEVRHAKDTNPLREPIDNPYAESTWDTCFHFGEWLEADSPMGFPPILEDEELAMGITPPSPPSGHGPGGLRERAKLGNPEVATAYFSYSAGLLAECAAALGKKKMAKKYRKISKMAKKAYRFLFAREGRIHSDRQAHYVRPLALGLLKKKDRQAAADDLAALVARKGYHIGTGFLSTVFICQVLGQYGHLDTAYRLLEQTTMPSWLYSVTKGATTIWESWNGIDEEGRPHHSHNHYSYGAVCGWLIETVAGIRPSEDVPGFEYFIIEPRPGGSLTHASASFQSPYGEIKSAWKLDGKNFILDVSVPVNTSATICLPDGSIPFEVGSGTYQYRVSMA